VDVSLHEEFKNTEKMFVEKITQHLKKSTHDLKNKVTDLDVVGWFLGG
jgi:hypothetical protein